MSKLHIAFVCAALFAVSAFVVAQVLRARDGRPVYRALLFTCFMALGGQLAYILEILAWSEGALRYLYNLTLPFATLAALGALLLVIYFYGLESYINRKLVGMMLVLPLITAALAFAGDPGGLLFSRLEIIALEPVYQAVRTPGVWFWAHAVYSYLLLGIALAQAVHQHLRLPPAFRVGSLLMICVLLVAIVTSLISLLALRNSPLNINIVGTSISLALLYVVMINNQRMDILLLARSRIMDHLDSAVLVLDKEQGIVECNRVARDWLLLWAGTLEVRSVDEVRRLLKERGALVQKSVQGERGVDIHLQSSEASRVYNVRREEILDRSGQPLGAILTGADVTQNRRLIQWLEKTSGTDALTGLPNRSSLYLRQPGFESDAALPLSVIMGDVNGLKAVNDNLGHRHGDALIQVIGQALQDCCPEGGAVFRTGGDEFVMLLPGTDEAGARAVIREIGLALERVEGHLFRPSIALGSATRTDQSVGLEELMDLADQTMYHTKRERRS